MPDTRRFIRWLDLVAHGLGPPCLAAAGIMFLLVPWTPAATSERELLCAALVLTGIGAGMVTSGNPQGALRRTGATLMTTGLAVLAAAILW